MKEINNRHFEGERALFMEKDIKIIASSFDNGESPLKHSKNIEILNSNFGWKYPLWYSKNIKIQDSHFYEMARAGIWYTKKISISNTIFECPKTFRKSRHIKIEDCEFLKGEETLWNCSFITLKNIKTKGNYFGMNSRNIICDNLYIDGNYPFDGCKNIEIHNSTLNSKDAFWNCENVKVYNSIIKGEYLGWNSKNVTFINCQIESLQGFCYMNNLKLVDCVLNNTTLAFEYSSINAKILSKIDSIKNPFSGTIICKGVNEIIQDDPKIDTSKIKIIIEE